MLAVLPRPNARTLASALAERPVSAVLELVCKRQIAGRAAVLSSFGADSVVLLHQLATVAPDAPVLFLQTGKHFLETLEYRTKLASKLGLTNVIDLKPDSARLRQVDPTGTLHQSDPEACCAIRKVEPLGGVLGEFDVLVTGRRRYQTMTRAALPIAEEDGPRVRVNPLAGWSEDRVEDYVAAHDLPRHPLTQEGYRSIGCAPCTSRTEVWEDARAGRWRGLEKTECGIHRAAS